MDLLDEIIEVIEKYVDDDVAKQVARGVVSVLDERLKIITVRSTVTRALLKETDVDIIKLTKERMLEELKRKLSDVIRIETRHDWERDAEVMNITLYILDVGDKDEERTGC